jgi:hypothetical protein
MDYALKLLKKKLRKERVKSVQCRELLQGANISGMPKENIRALDERRSIAKARIIDLQEAIRNWKTMENKRPEEHET